MKKTLITLLEKTLKEEDLLTLSHLYLYRAMDIEQIFSYIYNVGSDSSSDKRKRTVIKKRLTENGLVTSTTYQPGKEAYQITNKGIEIVRYARDLPKEVLDDNKQVKRGYYTAADLNLNPRLINHQVHLNQIMLEFGEKARDVGLPWQYYDEKFLSSYSGIRPDGMISILDHDIFIEVDMATESKAQLIEKWQHYRSFVHSEEFRMKSRKIIVLFDVDNIISKNKKRKRIQLVKQTVIEAFLDEIRNGLDIVIKAKDDIIPYIFDSLIPRIINRNSDENNTLRILEESGWTLSYGHQLNKVLAGDFYNYFVRKLDDNGNVIKFSGTLQEYFLDFYLDEELSVLHRVENFNRNSHLFKEAYGRGIRLIIATRSIENLYEDLSLFGQKILGSPNLFVLDINKMSPQNELFQNLYVLGTKGEVYQIISRDHSRQEFKYQIGKTGIKNKKGRIVEVKNRGK